MKPEQNQCLNDIKDSSVFAGICRWSRGGGWLGPYITNELWCDLNAYVISHWSQNTDSNEEEIFIKFTQEIGPTDKDAKAFRKIALLSNRGVLLGRSSKITRINPWWIRNQYMGGLTPPEFNNHTDEAWGSTNKEFSEIVKMDLVDEILQEKDKAVEFWHEIEQLANSITSGDEKLKDYIRVSSSYGRIKYEIIQQAWIFMLKGLEGDKSGTYDKDAILIATKNMTNSGSNLQC